jgi:hypothetical protein
VIVVAREREVARSSLKMGLGAAAAIALGLIFLGLALAVGVGVYLWKNGDPNTPRLKAHPGYAIVFPHGTIEHTHEANPIGGADAARVRYYATELGETEILAFYEPALTARGFVRKEGQQEDGPRRVIGEFRDGDVSYLVAVERPPVPVTKTKTIVGTARTRFILREELRTTTETRGRPR